jgi:hypothetical protein
MQIVNYPYGRMIYTADYPQAVDVIEAAHQAMQEMDDLIRRL